MLARLARKAMPRLPCFCWKRSVGHASGPGYCPGGRVSDRVATGILYRNLPMRLATCPGSKLGVEEPRKGENFAGSLDAHAQLAPDAGNSAGERGIGEVHPHTPSRQKFRTTSHVTGLETGELTPDFSAFPVRGLWKLRV